MAVRRLLDAERTNPLTTLHVRIAAEMAGVTERTVWRWLAQGREGRFEAPPRRGSFRLSDALWQVLAEAGGNVAQLHRTMTKAKEAGDLDQLDADRVPSVPTLYRVVKHDLRQGRILQIARPAGPEDHPQPSPYDRALADLALTDAASGPPVLDDPDAEPAAGPDPDTPAPGGVRLHTPQARLVSTRQAADVVDAIGHTIRARGIICVYGDPGRGKTVAVEQALHLIGRDTPVWRTVAQVAPGISGLRALLCHSLHLPSPSLAHRPGAAGQALTAALTQPGVLFLDDAQRLTPPLLDYLRQLWDAPGCSATLILCGAGSERTIARVPELRSRILTWHHVDRLDRDQLPHTLSLFHPVWAQAQASDLTRADEQIAHGNFRTWAKITSHLHALRHRRPHTPVTSELITQASTRLGPHL
ncbi:AAA family ATPase [Streptomyces chartreusis]|uniref:AAA family ATPase n=1 Tax=Streptomyces chartreusis TaxID=1969 RepID=UPI0035D80094